MVGSDAGATKPGEKVLVLLNRSGLMASSYVNNLIGCSLLHPDRVRRYRTQSLRHMRITSKGFQFLLEDVNTQLWDLLLVYLEESQVRSSPRWASVIVRTQLLVRDRIWSKRSGFFSCSVPSSSDK